ncbi:MAG: hypothetical protein V4733_03180 [Verrucomicrobiota bacterium]
MRERSLPIWKRKLLLPIDAEREKILAAGRSEEAELEKKGASAVERKSWLIAWNRKHKKEFRALIAAQTRVIGMQKAPEPVREELQDLEKRLGAEKPVVSESDMPTLEFLIPSATEMRRPEIRGNPRVMDLIAVYQKLAAAHPVSASRRDLLPNHHFSSIPHEPNSK